MKKEEVLDQLKWRYATKVFNSDKKIPNDLWAVIEDSLVLTPSSFGLQPWKFLVVTDQSVKEQLVPHSWNQEQVSQCSQMVVLTALKDTQESDVNEFIEDIHSKRGGDIEDLDPYKGMILGFLSNMKAEQIETWAKNQVYIALGQLMTTAAMLEVDACPMEGIIPAQYDEILGLSDSRYTTVLACPMGYRCDDDKYAELAKVRHGKARVIDHI